MAPRQKDAVEWSRWFQLQCIMGRWGEKIPYLVIMFTYNAFFKAANKNALLVLQIAGLWQFCSIKTCRPNGIKCMQLARSTRLASVRDVLSYRFINVDRYFSVINFYALQLHVNVCCLRRKHIEGPLQQGKQTQKEKPINTVHYKTLPYPRQNSEDGLWLLSKCDRV